MGLETTGRGDSQMYSMTFANWDEFETMMEGFNTDFPAMAGWQFARGDIINGEQIGPHIARIRAPSMRAVVFSGIQREDEDGVLTLDIVDVTGQDLCDIQTRLQLPADLVHDPDGRACTGVTEGLPQYAVAGSGDPLVIRRTAAAEDGTVAFLESLQLGGVRARTNGTRAGFDFSAVPGGGQQWTGLVYRTGEGETYRSAIEATRRPPGRGRALRRQPVGLERGRDLQRPDRGGAMNASRDLLIALVLIAVVASACNEDGPVSPAAPSPVAAATAADSAARAIAAEPETLAGGGPQAAAMNAGTCVSGPGFVRCWHFYPTLVLWVSPNSAWARNGTPFVHYLRIGLQGAL